MPARLATDLDTLLTEVRRCSLCAGSIPAPNPVLRADIGARILIIGQAPGTRVHASGIPWDDPSGERLRSWLGVSDATFYDQSQIAIVPMGFCYPGKGKSGDLPPRPECAATWHDSLIRLLPNIRCTLLIGQYAQKHYLPSAPDSVTERVRRWQDFAPAQYPLPHPSPRNRLWLRRNPWFEEDVVPALQATLRSILGG